MWASLALISGVLGIASYLVDDLAYGLAGGLLMIANWPYMLVMIAPLDKRLHPVLEESAGPESRRMIAKWGRLQAVPSLLGLIATIVYVVAVDQNLV